VKVHAYEPRGRYFEDFEVGDSMVSPGRTVTETDVVLFCGLSGDYNELHSNVEYAKQTLFGRRIAHGPLGLTLAVGLANRLGFMEGTAQAFLSLAWKFKGPIFIGDTVHVQASVAKKRATKELGGGMMIIDVALLNQNDEVVQEGTWTVLMKSRPDTE
jgi:3-hydroxybutyryl-CoA dehydratase